MPSPPKKRIMLFTDSYPFGTGEQFLETEILFLAEQFLEVFIVPGSSAGAGRSLPANCKVVAPLAAFSQTEKVRYYFTRNFFKALGIFIFTLKTSRQTYLYKSHLKDRLIMLCIEIEKAKHYYRQLKGSLSQVEILYFYWFLPPAFHFAILKKAGLIQHKMVTRAHGYDYDHLQGKTFYFREFEISAFDYILPVSDYGKEYFLNHYREVKAPVMTSRLGVRDVGVNEIVSSKTFRIVSCSSFIPVKRVQKLVEILRHLSVEVVWTHFGTGPLEAEIKQAAKSLPGNVKTEFMGHLDNKTVLDFYRNEQVDLFVNVSELEGIPVSIMEAISFGIPAVGCNTCGVPEIVTAQTGLLLDVDFKESEAAERISDYYHRPAGEKKKFRTGVKNFWMQEFNAEKNYSNFIRSYLN